MSFKSFYVFQVFLCLSSVSTCDCICWLYIQAGPIKQAAGRPGTDPLLRSAQPKALFPRGTAGSADMGKTCHSVLPAVFFDQLFELCCKLVQVLVGKARALLDQFLQFLRADLEFGVGV